MSKTEIDNLSIEELEAEDMELTLRAREATQRSHAPYSSFRVGAALRLKSGAIICGSNFESEVYPATMCAERVALYYALTQHSDDPIESVAIASQPSERECAPCGQCRQVLLDAERRQGSPIRIIMSGETTASIAQSAEALLPYGFKL